MTNITASTTAPTLSTDGVEVPVNAGRFSMTVTTTGAYVSGSVTPMFYMNGSWARNESATTGLNASQTKVFTMEVPPEASRIYLVLSTATGFNTAMKVGFR